MIMSNDHDIKLLKSRVEAIHEDLIQLKELVKASNDVFTLAFGLLDKRPVTLVENSNLGGNTSCGRTCTCTGACRLRVGV